MEIICGSWIPKLWKAVRLMATKCWAEVIQCSSRLATWTLINELNHLFRILLSNSLGLAKFCLFLSESTM